jgi:hypothetical protein
MTARVPGARLMRHGATDDGGAAAPRVSVRGDGREDHLCRRGAAHSRPARGRREDVRRAGRANRDPAGVAAAAAAGAGGPGHRHTHGRGSIRARCARGSAPRRRARLTAIPGDDALRPRGLAKLGPAPAMPAVRDARLGARPRHVVGRLLRPQPAAVGELQPSDGGAHPRCGPRDRVRRRARPLSHRRGPGRWRRHADGRGPARESPPARRRVRPTVGPRLRGRDGAVPRGGRRLLPLRTARRRRLSARAGPPRLGPTKRASTSCAPSARRRPRTRAC